MKKVKLCESAAPSLKWRCELKKGHKGAHENKTNCASWGGKEDLVRILHPQDGVGVTEREAEEAVRTLLRWVGEDPQREGLLDTPRRVAKAWEELTSGYQQDPAKILARDFHGNGYDQMVVCKRIEFTSICEHHLLPFLGHAWVAYIPGKRVVGLSKMARLVDCFSRRLQIQEKLTQQVAQAMQEHLKPIGVGVMVEAVHCCMSCRGVMKRESSMVTTALVGAFKQHRVREEFLMQCK